MSSGEGSAEASTAHRNRYDRQLRLWGYRGQKRLETAHIAVLGSGPLATETLKNLVLPNISKFTLFDDKKVDSSDLGNNFFLEPSDIGSFRAQAAVKNLLEMNSGVKGFADTRSPVELIDKFIDVFAGFDLVIGTQLPEFAVAKLGAFLYSKGIPFINSKVNGFLFLARVVIPDHQIIETHPENNQASLFVHPDELALFPEYEKYLHSLNMKAEDVEEHAHVPFVAILVQLTKKWREEHDGALPKVSEADSFKKLIKSHSTAFALELNYQEAVQFAFLSYKDPRTQASAETLNALKDPLVETSSSDFWVLVSALKKFLGETKGIFPASSEIPDMVSMTEYYVKIKELFREKFHKDVDVIQKFVKLRLLEVGRDPASISREDIELFVLNSRNISIFKYRPLELEFKADEHFRRTLEDQLNPDEDEEDDPEEEKPAATAPFPVNIQWYAALRAADRFRSKFGYLPGQGLHHSEDDLVGQLSKLKDITLEMLKEWEIDPTLFDLRTLEEIVRYGGCELHTISAFGGGLCAETILKIVTKQYVPFNNTVLYNGINCTLDRWEL